MEQKRNNSTQLLKQLLSVIMVMVLLFGIVVSAEAAPKPTAIKLNKTSLTMSPKTSVTLKATVTPAKASQAVTWKSSNSSVVSVNSKGQLSANKAGTAVITVVSKTNTKLKATCKVTVKGAVSTPKPTSVTLNSKTYKTNMKSFTLKATIAPKAAKQNVTWTSSNKAVATVSSSGVVTPKKAGTVTITATSTVNNKLKATCKVTVTANVESVKLNKTTINMLGKSVQLTATCSPAGSSKKVTWTTSNKKVATVSSSGLVKPVGYGTCTITAKSGNGKVAKCTVNVSKTQKITKEHTVAKEGPYLIRDTITVYVDGKTGKIVSSDCFQTKSDTGMVGVIIKDGIKVTNTQSTYITVRSTYTVKLGLGKWGLDLVTRSNYYKMDNQGNLTVTDASASHILEFLE